MTSADTLFEQLVENLERTPDFDVDAFLSTHSAFAPVLLERLAKLKLVDFVLGAANPENDATQGLTELLASQKLNPVPPSFHGSISERYELIETIGDGGMGTVFRAWDRDLDREVAIKTVRLRSSSAGSPSTLAQRLRRFLNEARITGLLEHPNIVPVHDLGVLPSGRLFFAMKLVDGVTLTDHFQISVPEAEASQSLPARVSILLKVCDALAFAHQRGVIHRDLKPENIMIGRFGEVQVMDWGLVKILQGSAAQAEEFSPNHDEQLTDKPSAQMTSTGSVFGTPAFMAPEQALGKIEDIGQTTDVFGLGALLFFMITGRAPFHGQTRTEIIANASACIVPPLPSNTPFELRAICKLAMSENPEKRYQSVIAFAADLNAFQESRPGKAWKDNFFSRARKAVRRHPSKTIAIAATIFILLSSWSTWSAVSAASAQSKLNDWLITDADRRQLFFDFERSYAEGFTEDQPPKDLGAGAYKILWAMVLRLRSLGIPLYAGSNSNQIIQAIRDAENYHPGSGHQATAVLMDLWGLIKLRNLRAAWDWKQNQLPDYMTSKSHAYCERLYTETKELCDLWPLLKDTEEALRTDEWHTLFRQQSESWYRYHKVDLAKMRSAPSFPLNRASDLFPFALFTEAIWSRSVKFPDQVAEGVGDLAFELTDQAFQIASDRNLSNYWIHDSAIHFLMKTQRPGDLERAKWHAELGLVSKPESAVAMNQLAALILLTSNDMRRAITLTIKSLGIDPQLESAYLNLATALLETADLNAIANTTPLLEQGASLFPENASLQDKLTQCHRLIER